MSTIEYSLASQEYLRPENPEHLGDAILDVTCTKNGEHFILEVYEEKHEDHFEIDTNLFYRINGEKFFCKKVTRKTSLVPPWSNRAATFVERRFKHGYRVLTRNMFPTHEVPITDYSVELIRKAWTGKKKISEMAKPFIDRIFMREFKAELNAKRAAEWRHNGSIPTNEWFDNHDKKLAEKGITLNAYQKVASYNSCMSKSYGYFCDPGTGKTCMMIRKLDYIIDCSTRETFTLVVCPKNVRMNWINEINKFSTNTHRIFITTLYGKNATDRAINFINDVSSDQAIGKHIVVIAGYEAFVETPKLFDFEWDLCLFDEAHNIANPGTKRTKTFLKNKNKFANVVIATGTPFRNSPFDIYTQLEFLGEGYSGFDSFNAFKQFYGIYTNANQYSKMQRLDGFQNIPLLQEKIAKHCFVIRKEEALPHLPQKTFSILECNLSHEQAKVYINLAEKLTAELETYDGEPDSITVNNILTQMLRLAQITSGFTATDNGVINRFDPNPKLELLVKHFCGDKDDGIDGVLTNTNTKALVWCAFKENLKMIQARLALEGVKSVIFHGSSDDKPGIVDQFNCDPETRVFIGIAASGGVGLNLVGFDPYNPDKYTTNTEQVIFYSSNWSSVNRLQAMDRSHRHNTRVPQHIVDLLAAGSIDMEIYRRVEAKIQMSLGIQDIKNILKSIVNPQVNGW